MIVRCKYYVSSIETAKPEQYSETPTKTYVYVNFNAVKSNDPNSENYSYWTASPCGQLKLKGTAESMAQYVPGTYWYFDFEVIEWEFKGRNPYKFDRQEQQTHNAKLQEDGIWMLQDMSAYTPGFSALVIKMVKPYSEEHAYGEFTVTINNNAVFDAYKQIGDLYRMTVSPATK